MWDVDEGGAAGPPVVLGDARSPRPSWVTLIPAASNSRPLWGRPRTGPDSDAGFAGTVWDVGGGKPLLSVPMGRQSKIFTITGGQAVFSPNDRQLLVLWGGGGVGTAPTWGLTGGKPLSDEQYLPGLPRAAAARSSRPTAGSPPTAR